METGLAERSAAIPMNRHPERIVRHEQAWFALPKDHGEDGAVPRISASRWVGFADEAREEVSSIETDGPVLSITLRSMDVTLFAAHKLVHDGPVQQGMMRVNEPGLPLRQIVRGGYDALHLHIPKAVIEECCDAGCRESKAAAASLSHAGGIFDPAIERLARALIRADDFVSIPGQFYADSVGLAIVARLLGKRADGTPLGGHPRVSGLLKWRLKRAIDYVVAHLAEPIGLAEIAASTGLTRMHFAAQFRVATGLRPHEYLVRRRVERAQELLATSQLPLIEVALAVGFKTQAHFTTVFTRIVGATPKAWRQEYS